MTDLGTFGENPGASAINEAGDVVGSGWFPAPPGGPRPHAFRYSAATGVKAVFPDDTWSYGWDINDNGIAVGAIAAGGNAFWQGAAGAPTLFTEPGTSANANAINSSNEMVGWVLPNTGIPKAFLYSTALGMNANLGKLLGPQFNGGTDARAIDDLGRIVGLAGYLPVSGRNWWDQGHAFVIPRGGTIQDLTTLKAANSTFATLSAATATNGTLIAGWGFRTDGEIHGYRYHEGGTTEEIGGLPAKGCAYSAAYGINAHGDVVGTAFPAPEGGVSRAILYTSAGQLYDLNDFVDPTSGWVLSEARDINNTNHEVVGFGTHGTLGIRAFKIKVPDLSPCSPSPLACKGSGVRDLSSGQCVYPAAADGVACSDGNACTVADSCRGGACVPGQQVTLSQSNPCATETCDPLQGVVRTPTAENATCQDGNSCTLGDACHFGICQPGGTIATACTAPGGKFYAPIVEIPPPVGSASEARDISDPPAGTASQVVGYVYDGDISTFHSFRYSDGSSATITAASSLAYGINASGLMVGALVPGGGAFSQPVSGDVTPFQIGPGQAWDVNDLGQSAGFYYPGGGLPQAFRYGLGMVKPLGMLPAPLFGGTDGRGIDSIGRVVGYAGYPIPHSQPLDTGHAVIYTDTGESGELKDLNDTAVGPKAFTTLSIAQAINGKYVVGYGVRADNSIGGFRYHLDTNTVDDIGSLPGVPGSTQTTLEGLNARGDAVGHAFQNQGGDNVAFVYTNDGRFYNLNDFVDPASGWKLEVASAINSRNEVVGYGTRGAARRAFKMKLPVPSNGPDLAPSLLGIAQVGTTLKAVFDYATAAATTIPHGPTNIVTDQSGASPPEAPPTTFVPTTHAPFVATMFGSSLTWTLGTSSVTATTASPHLTVTTLVDGTHEATLPDGRRVNLDSGPPSDPGKVIGPSGGVAFNGVLKGQFSVTSSGAATYTLPISLPPGIAGMAPNLALAYNSQSGDGIAGQGWELGGLSMISRCPRTRQQEGSARPVMLDSLDNPTANSDGLSDAVCLDGHKLLETSPGSGHYVSESEDFSSVTRLLTGGVDTFTVVTKSGETRYYGRLNNTTVARPGSAQGVVWLLDRDADRWGNFFDIQYNNGKGNGPATLSDVDSFGSSGIWVSKIKYTGSLTDSSCAVPNPPDSCFFASITFQYECRPDVRWTQVGSLHIPKSQRLRAITTPQGTYSLTYHTPVAQSGFDACAVGLGPQAYGMSQLDSIGYCAGTTCMQPATFTWQGGLKMGDWARNPNWTMPDYVASLNQTKFLDINGDGRQDFVFSRRDELATFLNTGTGWQRLSGPGQPFPVYLADNTFGRLPVRFADFDGDGKLDVMIDSGNVVCSAGACVTCPVDVAPGAPGCVNPTKYSPAVWLNRFSPDGQSGQWQFDTTLSAISGVGPPVKFSGNNPSMLADLDGDGKTDLVGVTQVQNICDENSPPGCDPRVVGTTVTMYLNSYGSSQGGWSKQTRNYTTATDSSLIPLFSPPAGTPPMLAQDVNRDGLADLVNETYFSYPDGSIQSTEWVFINNGSQAAVGSLPAGINFTVLKPTPAPSGGAPFSLASSHAFADLDGNGFYDLVHVGSFLPKAVGVGFGTGTGYSALGPSGAPLATSYSEVFKAFLAGYSSGSFSWYTVDIDGDGLADLVKNHPFYYPEYRDIPVGGEILLNTGLTWLSLAGHTSFEVSAGANRIPAATPDEEFVGGALRQFSDFVDVDGDGMPDLVTLPDLLGAGGERLHPDNAGQPFNVGPLMNPNAPLLIKQFPNGLAAPSTVTYVSTASAAGASTYKDDDVTDVNTKRLALPVNVVSGVIFEDGSGTGANDTITYTYHSLRSDPKGRGPLGFHRVEAFDEASHVRTVTTYAQAYPYTGLPIEVDKYQVVGTQSHLTSKTTTTYCDSAAPNPPTGLGCASLSPGSNAPSTTTLVTQADGTTIPPGTTTFVAPSKITDIAYLHSESDNLTDRAQTVSTFTYDTSGNSTSVDVSITKTESGAVEMFRKAVTNTYATAQERKEGKPDSTKVVSQGGTNEVDHETTFEYAPASTFGGLSSTLLALSRKHVEPNGGSVRLDTAYKYDKFGNLVAATGCASDFESCTPGATNPSNPNGSGVFTTHPPFRTATTSYDPASLGVPVSYGLGRFPSKITNPRGQSVLTVYDPILGKVLTSTDPNGIQTCYSYDPLGRLVSETDRCTSVAPLVSTTQYFLAVSGPGTGTPPNSAVVVITTPATNAPTWNYSDDQGKSTGKLSYAFDGGFIETTMSYNALGQVTQLAKPFHLAALADQVTPSYTKTTYDSFHRIYTVTDPLGVIDSSGLAKSTTLTMSYNGSTIETDRTVNGSTQKRFETKNANGKVEKVQTMTANGLVPVFYAYDADANLTCVDENGDSVNDCKTAGVGQLRSTYDASGRKISTVDPDMGTWQYCYNGFGDLYGQIDAKGSGSTCTTGTMTVSMTYDVLGRMLSKTDATGTANWVYDTAHGAGIGKLAVMVSAPDAQFKGTCGIPQGVPGTGGQVAVKSYAYTDFGDLQEVYECADGALFETSYQYDSLGRQSLIRYPAVNTSQLAVGYHYTGLGYLHYMTDESTDYSVLWQAKAVNVLGQVTDEQMKNGVETVSTRNSTTGWLLGATATAHADNNNVIQNQGYEFDELGNLLSRSRSDAASGNLSQERFGYDLTNRLTTATTSAAPGPVDQTYSYDALGNLTQKAGKSYAYDSGCPAGARSAGPHAVCSVGGGPQFRYDDNGNLASDGVRSLTYNPANRVTGIENGAAGVAIMYGADGNRVVQAATSGNATARTVYVGLGTTGKSLLERTTKGTTVTNVHYIYAGGMHGGSAFALRVIDGNGVVTANQYYSFDHLGSVTAMSDAAGRVATVQSAGTSATVFSYDPWGARRNPDGTVADPASFPLPTGAREFTGQEQIPDVGLVNMNGRVYDPVLGRFLSPDPNVQFRDNLQNYNRYSYVGNNPLRYTDPTGYFWSELGQFFEKTFSNPMTDVELGLGIGACVVSSVACLVVGIELAVFNSEIAIANGAGVGETIGLNAFGLGIGLMAGGVGADGSPLMGLLFGSASSAYLTAASEASTGISAEDMLGAALLSAATGAVTMGLAKAIAVSQAQGGTGSGERQAEVAETAAAQGGNDGSRRHVSGADLLGEKVEHSNAAILRAKGLPVPTYYKLSDAAVEELGPVFNQLGYDVSRVRVSTGGAWGMDGFTLGDAVHLTTDSSHWSLGLMAHEITHSVQFDLRPFYMAGRYTYEAASTAISGLFGGQGISEMYGPTSALSGTQLSTLDVFDTRVYLDQIADRVALLSGLPR
ncbi:MAG: RHS repeat-associated core domain-containing protein [Myxococcales bacterium]